MHAQPSDALPKIMFARYYSNSLGRFLSVDPVLGNLVSPQSWNRFRYAANNPLKYLDPDGEDEFLFTWAPEGDQVGHSAVGVQLRDSDGTPTGQVQVRHLWPDEPVGKSQTAGADYRSEVISESDLASFEGGEGRGPDGIIRISGDATQDAKVSSALDAADDNATYHAQSNSCCTFAKTGIEATGISGGTGGTVTVTALGGLVNKTLENVTTPVSVHNAVAGSGDERVNVIRELPKDKSSPDIHIGGD